MNDIRTRITLAVAAAAFAVAALAGCAATTDTGSSTTGPASISTSTPGGSATLTTASTSLGAVVVDGRGMTVYVFDHDRVGASSSACTGACATTWPAVESDSTTPTVTGVTGTVGTITGVTGTVGTITGVDGKPQVTLNGLPLYTYASDSAAGDVDGQGVGGIWWVVGSDGAKLGAGSGGSDDSPSHDATPDDNPTSGHKPGY